MSKPDDRIFFFPVIIDFVELKKFYFMLIFFFFFLIIVLSNIINNFLLPGISTFF